MSSLGGLRFPVRARWPGAERFVDGALPRLGLFADLLPRTIASSRAARHGDTATGIPPSPIRPRVLGETALDEFFVALNGLVRSVSSIEQLRADVDRCGQVADELVALRVSGVNPPQPSPEIIERTRKRFGATVYQHIEYRSDLTLPDALCAYDHFTDRNAAARVLGGDVPGGRWLIWVHGAAQGRGDDLYAFRAQHLYRELGFNVVLPVLPAHGGRRHREVSYPGFDPLLNVAVEVRALAEIRSLITWINENYDPADITVAGTSLGGPLAAMVAGVEPSVRSVLAVVPMLDVHSTLAHHVARAGRRGRITAELLRSPQVRSVSSVADPLAVTPAAPAHRRMVIAALNDRVTWVDAARQLHDHWGGRIHWARGGHVGQTLSGEVRGVTDEFLAARP